MCLGVVRHLNIYAIVELFTSSAESDLLTIRAYAAAVYRAVSDTTAHLLGGRVYWACRKRTVETAMLVCAYTRALHAPGDGMWDNKWTTLTDDPPNTNRL